MTFDSHEILFDTRLVVLLSKTAFERELVPHPKRDEGFFDEEWTYNWGSTGCEKEYLWAQSHFIQVLELESFLLGKEVLL